MPHDSSPPERCGWSLIEAAKHSGAARSTIQRYIDRGKMPNAYRTQSGMWSISVEDLVQAGLMRDQPAAPRVTPDVQHLVGKPEDPTAEPSESTLARRVAELEAELAGVRELLQAERARLASEQRMYSDHIADLRRLIPVPAVTRLVEHQAAALGENQTAS